MAIPIPPPSTEGRHQVDAMVQRINRMVVFCIVPTPRNEGPSSGTGVLVRLRGKQYFVSALHNFFYDFGGREQVVRSLLATRFRFHNGSPLGNVESLNEAVNRVEWTIGSSLPVPREEDILIDARYDLIAVRLDPSWEQIAHAEFVDLETESFTAELTTGLSLLMFGVPIDSLVDAPGGGPTLIPQLDHVRYDAEQDTTGISYVYDAPAYFFLPYSLARDGIKPHGFSGAPVFVNKETTPIWTSSPHIVGIALRYFPLKSLLVAAKTSTVLDLLNTDLS